MCPASVLALSSLAPLFFGQVPETSLSSFVVNDRPGDPGLRHLPGFPPALPWALTLGGHRQPLPLRKEVEGNW